MKRDRLGLVALGVLLASLGSVVPSRGSEEPSRKAAAATAFEVEKFKNLSYCDGAEADADRHKLDLYCPKAKKSVPFVLFVHGGSWKSGDKSLYTGIGEAFAKAGIGMAICNYRLTPQVQHPAHIRDVAKAFAWTCDNIGQYGGDPKSLFVCGHSAGGHLVSLLATDPSYLKLEKHQPDEIQGVISISGVYEISAKERVFAEPFGKDEAVCKNASPLAHVVGKHPRFLIAYGDNDYPQLDEMAERMHAALKKAQSPSELLLCKRRTHVSIIVNFIDPADSLNEAFRAFVLGTGK